MSKKWTMPIQDWGKAMNQFSIIFGDRLKFDRFKICHLHRSADTLECSIFMLLG
ncbi:hypothetical protein LEP1GSC133_0351 [Leptospira borgpetersenii serovar Pomona str. 200901868]|uniref:Uncharacterized protein n=1 Tax=Leptospira borgpetersenii serovar Pomona str. 200901868 TaxID=1192866 RepID=M6W256_LEPBO|nr:hypothetical protein LEP1GSC133_0351 [Leptospira borgpetersenii serovar Pomona str. 200901868]